MCLRVCVFLKTALGCGGKTFNYLIASQEFEQICVSWCYCSTAIMCKCFNRNPESAAQLNNLLLHHSPSSSGFLATLSETGVDRTGRSISRGGRRLQSDSEQPSPLPVEQETTRFPQKSSSNSITQTGRLTNPCLNLYLYHN